jgi:hypothetical protein
MATKHPRPVYESSPQSISILEEGRFRSESKCRRVAQQTDRLVRADRAKTDLKIRRPQGTSGGYQRTSGRPQKEETERFSLSRQQETNYEEENGLSEVSTDLVQGNRNKRISNRWETSDTTWKEGLQCAQEPGRHRGEEISVTGFISEHTQDVDSKVYKEFKKGLQEQIRMTRSIRSSEG